MIPEFISNSFNSLYSFAYSNLLKGFRGEDYNPEHLNLQKIYAATGSLLDALRASLYSKTTNPETDVKRVYYNGIVWNLLKFRQLSKEHENHSEADLILVAVRCLESLQSLAGQTKAIAEAEGIDLKPYLQIDLDRDYALGGTYTGGVNTKIVDSQESQKTNETKLPLSVESQESQQANETKLSLKEIALIHVYEGKQITRQNSDEIASQYGHTSGEKLFQNFTHYSSSANRKGKPFPYTQKKLENKIKLLEKVVSVLPEDNQGRAMDELKILKNIFESEFQ